MGSTAAAARRFALGSGTGEGELVGLWTHSHFPPPALDQPENSFISMHWDLQNILIEKNKKTKTTFNSKENRNKASKLLDIKILSNSKIF